MTDPRPPAAEVPSSKLHEWFRADDLLGPPGEIVIDGGAPLENVERSILDHIGRVPVATDTDRTRLLDP